MEERKRKRDEWKSRQQESLAQAGDEPVPAARPSLPQGVERIGFNMELLRKFNTNIYWGKDGKKE